MHVILVQHGEAASKEIDPGRPLTDRGRANMDDLASRLSSRGLLPRQIWHSGKTRARQSAELLSAGAAPQPRGGLAPKDDPQPWVTTLAACDQDIMLVGHQPFLGKLAALLLTGDADRVSIGFVPGSACALERTEEGGWQIAWMLRPELFAPH